MPKREATPPPGDDEPRYLTICYPYPPHANMELPGDGLALARWLACCMGQDDLYAIFHKPSAGNMVIVEIRRDHPGFRQLLGAHKWSEFVKTPGEHYSKITRIYFSTFPNGRAVEKAGWKRIFVADNWFNGFSPNNKFIANPYPLSTYCELPSEDQTGFTLCRPIPREMFAIQVPTPPPVPVGSASWVAQKRGPSPAGRGSCAVASATRAPNNSGQTQPRAFLLPELQMPTPSSIFNGAILSPVSSTDQSSNGVYHRASSVGYSSSSSASYHSASPVNGSQSGGDILLYGSGSLKVGGSSSYGSESPHPEDYDSAGSGGGLGSNDYIAGGCSQDFDAPNLEDEFGTLSLQPTTNKDGTPLCPSHGVVCKKGICRDYADLLKKIEREKKTASFNNGGPARGGKDNGFGSRGRGRGNNRARGSSPSRGWGSPRGTAVAGGPRW